MYIMPQFHRTITAVLSGETTIFIYEKDNKKCKTEPQESTGECDIGSIEILSALGWQPLDKRRKYNKALFINKTRHNELPDSTTSMFNVSNKASKAYAQWRNCG